MKLRIGDKVRFLNETGEGVVSRIKDNKTVFVEMPDGFEIPYLSSQLVPIHTELVVDKSTENIELDPEAKLNDSVYFVIEPDHELDQLVSDFKIHLFNSSSYHVLYSYSIRDEEHFQTLRHGEAGPYQKVLLRLVKKQFFADYPFHRVECLFYKNSFYKPQLPVSVTINVSPAVLKASPRISHDEFDKPVYAFVIRDDFSQTEKVEQKLEEQDIRKLKAIKEFKDYQKKSKSRKEHLKSLEKTVDLHINELIENTQGLSNFEMLNIQLERVEKELDEAVEKGMHKLILIHGVGNGRLRQEIIAILKQMDGITYHDASFKEFGYGATQINFTNN